MFLSLLSPLLLAACGDLPEPFLGNPGATARRLAVPVTPMLAVPPPSGALLTDEASGDFADLLALSLQKEEVPTLARVPRKTDWRLAITAERKGDLVVPRYAVRDPSGRELGAIDGASVAASRWRDGAAATLGQAANDAVPKVLALMMSIRASRDRANPNSLLNRIAKLYVPAVTGAPGDGNVILTRLIRTRLAEFGPLVQTTPENTDFTVKGEVIVSPLPKGQQQIEVGWTVTRPSGVVTGKVSQLNSVRAGTLDLYWGDVAVVVTQEAASGVNTVVERFIGRGDAAVKDTKAPSEGPQPAAGTPPSGGTAPPNPPVERSVSNAAADQPKETGRTAKAPQNATAKNAKAAPGKESAGKPPRPGKPAASRKPPAPSSPLVQ
jgi:hypothetical protein